MEGRTARAFACQIAAVVCVLSELEDDRLAISLDQKLFNKYEYTGITTTENSLNDHMAFNTTKSNV